jgi:hypothetical protein
VPPRAHLLELLELHRETEATQLDLARTANQHDRRLDVAVTDAALVQRQQRRDDGDQHRLHRGDIERTTQIEQTLDRARRHKLADNVNESIVPVSAQVHDDVGRADVAEQLDFEQGRLGLVVVGVDALHTHGHAGAHQLAAEHRLGAAQARQRLLQHKVALGHAFELEHCQPINGNQQTVSARREHAERLRGSLFVKFLLRETAGDGGDGAIAIAITIAIANADCDGNAMENGVVLFHKG